MVRAGNWSGKKKLSVVTPPPPLPQQRHDTATHKLSKHIKNTRLKKFQTMNHLLYPAIFHQTHQHKICHPIKPLLFHFFNNFYFFFLTTSVIFWPANKICHLFNSTCFFPWRERVLLLSFNFMTRWRRKRQRRKVKEKEDLSLWAKSISQLFDVEKTCHPINPLVPVAWPPSYGGFACLGMWRDKDRASSPETHFCIIFGQHAFELWSCKNFPILARYGNLTRETQHKIFGINKLWWERRSSWGV